MKIFNFVKQTCFIGMIFFSTGLIAQQVIYEDANPGSENMIQYNFNQADYTKISNKDGRKTFIKNKVKNTRNHSSTRGTEDDTYILQVFLTFDEEEFDPPTVVLIYNEQGDRYFGYYDDALGGVSMELDAGVYDIDVDFRNIVTGSNHTVIREMVDIEAATDVNINVAEATNDLAVEVYDESGDILQPGITDDTSGQTSSIFLTQSVYFEAGNLNLSSGSVFSNEYDDENPALNFYINDVSDRYSFIHSGVGLFFGDENYFTKFETISGISDDIVLQNDPDGWVHNIEKFKPSVLGNEAGDLYHSAITELFYNGQHFGGTRSTGMANPADPEEGFKFWLNNPLNDDPLDMLVYNAVVEFSDALDPYLGTQQVHINGNTMMSTQDGEVQYGSGSIQNYYSYLGNDYLIDDLSIPQLLNTNPRFSFLASQSPDMIVGDNTPISITAYKPGFLLTKYMGRYGEVRESDFFNTTIEVMQNENTIYSGGYIDFLSQPFPANGDMDITYTNTNTEVDGLAGKNTVHLAFNADENDGPPTLQRLQFRNSDGDVTDRFDSGTDGRMRIAAGDFQYVPFDDFNGYYTYNEGNNVEVSYSLYGQNDWSQLELTEYPEYFQVGYGDYYEASLEDVVAPNPNTWYDVRIKCTDAAGNTQDQTISPAFKITGTTGVENLSANGDIKTFPNPFTNKFTISLPAKMSGDFTLRITDILGKTVYSENSNVGSSKNWVVQDAGTLPKGVYMLSLESQNERMVKKIVRQ